MKRPSWLVLSFVAGFVVVGIVLFVPLGPVSGGVYYNPYPLIQMARLQALADGFRQAGGTVVALVMFLTAGVLYLLPTIVAGSRHKQNAGAISVLNVLLGWTLVGWVVALVWSMTVEQAQVSPHR